MNGKQRTQAALAGQEVDRPPVMLHNFMHAAREAGYSMAEYRRDPRKIADCFLRSVEKYGYDAILVDVDTATLAGAVGVPIDFPADEPARTCGACLSSLAEVDRLQPPNVTAYRQVQVWLEAVAMLVDQCGDAIFIRGNCDQAPFSLASMMRGADAWMMDLVSEPPDRVHRLLEYCTRATTQFLQAMAQTGAHMVSNGDSPAGPSMISPAMYEQFALPYEQQVARATEFPYALHICGNTDSILHLMIQSGATALELDYQTDAQKAHDLLDGQITFIGNLAPTGVLTLGTPTDVTRAAEALIEVFSDTPHFILNAGCAIPPTAPPENIHALVAAARG